MDFNLKPVGEIHIPAPPQPDRDVAGAAEVGARGVLEVEGIDVLDGTPLLDIKPYVPDFDVQLNTRTGWYATRSEIGS